MRFTRSWFLAVMVGCAAPAALSPVDDAGAPSNEPPQQAEDSGSIVVPTDAGSTLLDASDAAGAAGLQVFVTSTTTTGNTGGLAGADAICQTLGELSVGGVAIGRGRPACGGSRDGAPVRGSYRRASSSRPTRRAS